MSAGIDSATYAELLQRQRDGVSAGLMRHAKRLRWSAEKIAAERQTALRDLLSHAAQHSPWHRDRLSGIDPAGLTLDALPALPVMGKDAMMAAFDDAVTDRALTLDAVEAHLHGLGADGYLDDRYRVVVTGGTSGHRGVFAYGLDDWVTLALGECRMRVLRGQITPPDRIATLFASSPMHMSSMLHAFTADPDEPVHRLPLTLPLEEIVAQLNGIQPLILQAFPTALALLIGEVRAGRLSIAPQRVKSAGELVLAADREAVRETWGVGIEDCWAVTEGVFTGWCEAGFMHLPDDLAIIEPVDADGRPVAPGEQSAKVYLTNLYNRTQPLIRYEIGDAMTITSEPCPCGSHHSRVLKLGGRHDDLFRYANGAYVHSIALYGPLESDRYVTEFQVRQTERGLDISVRCSGPADLPRLKRLIEDAIAGYGLEEPEVTINQVDALDRLWSGKLQRFVPLKRTDPSL